MTTCELCERPAGSDTYLCAACTRKTGEHLADLPPQFRQLAALLLPSRGNAERAPKSTNAPAPANLDVIDLRTALTSTLVSWQCALFDALTWDPPRLPDTAAARVESAAASLRVNLPWIAES